MSSFKAFRIHENTPNPRAGVEMLTRDDLSPGNVLIEVHYSGVNYKDALAGTGRTKILRKTPLIGGIDASGIVVSSEDTRFEPGDEVLINGCGLSEVHNGGYSELLRVPADWVVPLPDGLSLKQAMIIGTAGFTAALAYLRMVDNHQDPAMGPIAVTGASGGVGSFAIDILTKMGYQVAAFSGKSEARDYLQTLGAISVARLRDIDQGGGALDKVQWGGAIDNLGGDILDWLMRSTRSWGNVVSVGMAMGADFSATVMPFILRGVAVLGVTSANCPPEWRSHLWARLGSDLRPMHLDRIHAETIEMEQLPETFQRVLAGKITGRILVRIRGD
jgi:NADPH2:quinone reductase